MSLVFTLLRTALPQCGLWAQAMSYRSGHHSTSDDSSRYRTAGEMATWRARDPAARFRRLLDAAGWWDDAREQALRQATRKEVRTFRRVHLQASGDSVMKAGAISCHALTRPGGRPTRGNSNAGGHALLCMRVKVMDWRRVDMCTSASAGRSIHCPWHRQATSVWSTAPQ